MITTANVLTSLCRAWGWLRSLWMGLWLAMLIAWIVLGLVVTLQLSDLLPSLSVIPPGVDSQAFWHGVILSLGLISLPDMVTRLFCWIWWGRSCPSQTTPPPSSET